MFHKQFHITNLTCEACVKLSIMALKKIAGVQSATVDLKTGKAMIMADHKISTADINQSLKEVNKTTDL